jgi:hypothetical protein
MVKAPNKRDRDKGLFSGRSVAFWTIIGSIATVLSLLVGIVAFTANGRSPTPGSMEPESIKFDKVYDPVPRCAIFGGEGDVPANKTLWLAIFPNGPRKYFFRSVVVNAIQHNWLATNVTIGSQDTSPGSHFTIYAVLVDSATNQALQQGRFAGGITTLPDNFHIVNQIDVQRGDNSAPCK